MSNGKPPEFFGDPNVQDIILAGIARTRSRLAPFTSRPFQMDDAVESTTDKVRYCPHCGNPIPVPKQCQVISGRLCVAGKCDHCLEKYWVAMSYEAMVEQAEYKRPQLMEDEAG